MKKHAYLIIAHNEYHLLETLLSMLDDARNDIYLHIDLRADSLFDRVSRFKTSHAGFHLIKERINVYWGDISQVKAEYLLFETACRNGDYSYYHLLSGVDLPLKSQDYIHRFFKENNGKEFVAFWNSPFHSRDLHRKVSRYHFFLRYYKDKKHPLHGITSLCRNTMLAIQKITGFSRKKTFEFRKGPNWVSISHAFCSYLIEQKAAVMHRFRHTLCPDEIFLQTILWNSPFRDRIHDIDNPTNGAMRLIDWERGKPYVWQENDIDELLRSDALFARKFSSAHTTLYRNIKTSVEK